MVTNSGIKGQEYDNNGMYGWNQGIYLESASSESIGKKNKEKDDLSPTADRILDDEILSFRISSSIHDHHYDMNIM